MSVVAKYLIFVLFSVVLGLSFVDKKANSRFFKSIKFSALILVIFVAMDFAYSMYSFMGVAVVFIVLLVPLVIMLKISKSKSDTPSNKQYFK